MSESKLSDLEIWKLIKAARGEGRRAATARNKLILYNMGIAKAMAGRIAKGYAAARKHDDPELAQELLHAAIVSERSGFLRAIAEFDPGRGCRFTTTLGWWLRKAMVAALPPNGENPHVRSRSLTIRAKAAALEAQLGRPPSLEEIQAAHSWRRKPRLATIRAAMQPGELIPWDSPNAADDEHEYTRNQPEWHSDGFTEDDMIERLDRERRIHMVRQAVVRAGDDARELLADRRQTRATRHRATEAVAAHLPAGYAP